MKKLFLYLTILFVTVFLVAFFVTRSHFRNKGPINPTTEADTVSDQLAADSMSIIGNPFCTTEYSDSVNNENGSVLNKKDSAQSENNATLNGNDSVADKQDASDEAEDNEYIVGIKNGHVVVYKNSIDNVYEYTGVDANILKECNSEVYDMLENGIRFETLEELFNFLESIAS